MKSACAIAIILSAILNASAQVPDNLVVEGVPSIPPAQRDDAARYLEFRAASFHGWHPIRREILIATRFADSSQLHVVKLPGGDRRQLTFQPEPVAGGLFQPKTGECIVFSQDTGGGEFYQLHRYDLADGRVTLLTDGKSRNTGAKWSKSGRWLAYASTRRNGKDHDLYIIDPNKTASNRLLLEVAGGGWSVSDWSSDDTKLLVSEYLSINESRLYIVDVKTGAKQLITPVASTKVAYGQAQFAANDKAVFYTSDKDSEFQRLVRHELATQKETLLTGAIPWDVDDFEVSPDGQTIAFVTNEAGSSVLHLASAKTGREMKAPKLPLGVITGLRWHGNSQEIGFSLSSARSPADVYSIRIKSLQVERWTHSETGGLNPDKFVEPQLIKVKSFDGLEISAFVYRPDPKAFPGKRPVMINIHGGPESQARPIFMARNNYLINELGIALVVPNVRGSAGYGKTFLTLDNGFKREDSVKDIGAVLDWIQQDNGLDSRRVGVTGGSYGGYMALATMTHYNDRLRCGVDVVGISSFLTFLKNTQDYRRDLRRVEYGDEREPAMAKFLEWISPMTNAKKITKPLFVVQGKNDPRVPVTEAEQMVKAIRSGGGRVWYLMAKDEGHGFAKKKNADYQFLSTILFLKANLL